MMGIIVLLVVISLFAAMPVYAFIRMINSFSKGTEAIDDEIKTKSIDIISSFVLYALIVIGLLINNLGLKAGEQLSVYSETGEKIDGYASLSNETMITVIVLLILGFIAYGLLSTYMEQLSPILYLICRSLLVLNILFAAVYVTHTGFKHYDDAFLMVASVVFLQMGYVSLSFLYIAKLMDVANNFYKNKQEADFSESNKFMLLLYRFSFKCQKSPVLLLLISFPVLLIIQTILVLFGQKPDSFIRTFLDTSSFNYLFPAPKPEMVVSGDGHYLCTVTVKGHKKIVRPLRAGIRGGGRIVVNRQLLIANAFENLLEDYTPRAHKKIRAFYDTYGYPLSKHINNKWSADIIYIVMKPFEWFFLLVLYTVEKNPENRIHVQYSELRK